MDAAREQEKNETTFFPDFQLDRILFTNKKIEIQPVFQIQNESKKSSSDLDKETALVAEKFEFVNADLLKRYIVNKKMTVKNNMILFLLKSKPSSASCFKNKRS